MVPERSPSGAPPLPARPRTFRRNCGDRVSVTSPTKVYIETSVKSQHYSANDEQTEVLQIDINDELNDKVRLIRQLEQSCWLYIRTVLQDGEIEVQDLVVFLDGDSSDSGHFYESLEPAPSPPVQATHGAHAPHVAHATLSPHEALAAQVAHAVHATLPVRPLPLEEDFDSFDSDSDSENHDQSASTHAAPPVPSTRLPSPPQAGGPYTLTKIASAAQKKMRQIKRNLTKRYTVAMDGKPFTKSSQTNGTYDTPKSKTKSPIYANCDKIESPHLYTNVTFNDSRSVLSKGENPVAKPSNFKDELKTIISDKRHSNGDVPPLPDKLPPEKPTTPTNDNKKDSGTLSRKTYFSFKSRFRRASSMAVDINSDVPSALKITNSTFYLTDSMDGDSGFSNCSDNGVAGADTLSASSRRRDGTRAWAESTPCLAPPVERPAQPPPPPPAAPHAPRAPLAPAPPPPPPPHAHTDLSAVHEELKRLLPTLSRKDKGPRARTSWYAECGADSTPVTTTSTGSWYAEAGLYQAGNISSSSGASSGSHPASPLPHSLFTHEPLYQFYNAAKVESACRESGDSDSDGYEASAAQARPSAMALVAPRGPARTLWCEVPEVLNSAVLSSLAPAQKRLQEAKFEVLTSEASYLNSLNVLEAHFISHPAFRDPHILPPHDWDTLFATILPVRKCSQLLMTDLEKCWQENILLQDICDIVRRHAEARFHTYVKYCENQALMVRALQRLRDRPAFAAALKRLESHPACQSLSLHSFLMLPMQRVTRLPLLLDAVLRNLQPQDREYDGCMLALATLNDFVSQCNEGARNTERVEEMFRLARAIEFPAHVQDAPLLGPACSRRDRKPVRWLVRSGEMTQLIWKAEELKLTFGKKFHKVPLHLFLFNDLLVITKKKGEESFLAVDWCARSLLEVCSGETAPLAAKHALLLTLLENRDARTIEMVMSCPSETDASRWGEALAPLQGGAGEAVYAGWDCPQVAALYAYAPAQPDELPLAEGDVVNVTRKTSEGWYYGERTRDGEAGWFPGSYTAEIASAHVRARNLRQRYRLLALSGTYLGHRKRAP
ncbi:rho guanine nucleotide exchange factor 15-like [Battus philenor]|uniref:rho guanine nucleotide exchange factor 15-like n=1 Tax=Battus philenor TaxID=42288 RepID=UPI0035D091FE